jgi:hypothetical protein
MGLFQPHGVERIAGDPNDWGMAVQTYGGWFRTAVEIVEKTWSLGGRSDDVADRPDSLFLPVSARGFPFLKSSL